MAKKKLKKTFARGILVKVAKEMNQPRFVESARKEKDTNGHIRKRSSKNLKR